MTSRTKATKTRRRSVKKYVPPQHPCDRHDVRAIVFAIRALELTRREELALPDYINHRRELHCRLTRALAPDGGRFGRSAPVRLDVQIYRALRDRLLQRADDRYHGDFDMFVTHVLEAGLKSVRRRR